MQQKPLPEDEKQLLAEIEVLFSRAQQAHNQGDIRGMSILVNKILKMDFSHRGAWELLHSQYGMGKPIELFQKEFIQKYFPQKMLPIVQPPSISAPAPVPEQQPVQSDADTLSAQLPGNSKFQSLLGESSLTSKTSQQLTPPAIANNPPRTPPYPEPPPTYPEGNSKTQTEPPTRFDREFEDSNIAPDVQPEPGWTAWIRRHYKALSIAGVVVIVIILLGAILLTSFKTNALIGRWGDSNNWIQFNKNGTVVFNQGDQVEIQNYKILDDHRIEFRDSSNNVDIRLYTIMNNSLVINNTTYVEAGDQTPTPTGTEVIVIPPEDITDVPVQPGPVGNEKDLQATLSPGQNGWYLVVNGIPVEMNPEDVHFQETEITSVDRFPKALTKNPVVLARSDGFAHLSQLEIRSSVAGPGIVLGAPNDLVEVRTANNAAQDAGERPGDIVLAIDSMDVNKNLNLANEQLLGAFGTQVALKVMQGTDIKEMTLDRTVQVDTGTTDINIEPIVGGSTAWMRITPKTPLGKGLHCLYFNSRPDDGSLGTINQYYCFVIE